MYAGAETGVATPHTQASLRPLSLVHGSLEYTVFVPTALYLSLLHLRDEFLASLPPPTEDLAGVDEPASNCELVARFLEFIVSHVDAQPGQYDDVLALVLADFESRFLRANEVHAVATKLPGELPNRESVVRAYYSARLAANRPIKGHSSALLRAAADNRAHLYAIFGGQGNIEEYFDELRDVYSLYNGLVADFVDHCARELLVLAADERTAKVYSNGLDIMSWLRGPDSTPDLDYLVSAPVSFPLIGLTQLTHYAATCKVLGKHPGEFRSFLSGTTGHSQGIVTAAAIAASSSWESFYANATKALTILFWIGCRAQQTYPRTSLAPSILQDSVNEAEGKPSPMLSVRDLSKSQVQKHVDLTNSHLPAEKHVSISLENGARNFVVTGPPQSLYGLSLSLRKSRAPTGLEQNRVPYSERKLKFSNRFLPITAPFHSPYVHVAYDLIVSDLSGIVISPDEFTIPVYDTFDGHDLRNLTAEDGSVVERIVAMVTSLPVHWEKATAFNDATHIIDFGPGGVSGLGVLTHRNKEGTGVRVIVAGMLEGSLPELGYKPELFDREDDAVIFAANWGLEFAPKLVKTAVGKTYVDTRFSRLLGQPPIMVAGMTPSTVPADFVAATMNAGYHIELGGGGYFSASGLTSAFYKIEKSTFPGAGITVNLIYVNPRAMGWAIPLIAKLRSEGVPIEGLTIGAGVPSIEVANEYIETLGIKHLGLKPGSLDAIQQVINIAQANPNFPIILQWTGGRGGGHHSFEDFHSPILQTYPRIRRCNNIILLAGSGFGGADDTYPYLTGQWATAYGYPPMPFDGFLLGSRIMTAKEAHTSPGAKKAIVDATGVEDADWEKTYKGPAGGVITVLSEMGEPIHKLATRGVLFWKEMDTTIFSLPKAKRVDALKAKRDYIIKKLNADFQKVWFGKNAAGDVVELEDMTYGEILTRLVELMYISHESRWIDRSLRDMTGDYIRRIEERFTHATGCPSLLQSYSQLDKPEETVERILAAYPEASEQLINVQDMEFFLMLTLRPSQKPVPFVPILDDNFEYYFKKDSLWQSEDLAAVVDQDVQRTCILQGPVSVKYAKIVDEPVKDILDGIHNKHIEYLTRDVYGGKEDSIPVIEYFGGKAIDFDSAVKADSLTVVSSGKSTLYTLDAGVSGSAALPDVDAWLRLLGGQTLGWRHAFFTTDVFVQGTKYETSPLKRLFTPSYGVTVNISDADTPENTRITVTEKIHGRDVVVIDVFKQPGTNTIELTLYDDRTAEAKPVGLHLFYTYHPEVGFAPIREVMEGRNDRIKEFYWKLWFGPEPYPSNLSVTDDFEGGSTKVEGKDIADFVYAVGNNGEAFVDRPGKKTYAPMDFAIVVGWKAITKALFPKSIDGDLLKLVHLSNSFKMYPGAEPLKKDDIVTTTARINAVLNQESGKMVEVSGVISRDGAPVMEVTSQFLYRGVYTDFENTFQSKSELPMQLTLKTAKDVAVLRSKDWLELSDPHTELLNQTLTFRLESFVRYQNKTVFSSVRTTGQVLVELPTHEIIQIGSVSYEAAESHGNPVIDYLERHGSTIEQPILFENAIPLNGSTELVSRAPASNEGYARVSGDYNPIHVSRVFAAYAHLRGNITHGMYSSAAVRSLVETWAAENHVTRVRAFTCSFVGMVLPNDNIETKLHHIGMIAGRKIIKVVTTNKDTGDTVLAGQAEVEQPVSTYIFTGQGSQEQGMGMDLYESSPVAREVWDRADRHFLNNYGFSIINIVKNNPKEFTVHFGGPRGKAIRHNYTSMMFESVDAEGNIKSEKIFKEITENTAAYTFRSPTGLLSATQFTQPALTLMEKASFEDMKSKGLVPADCSYAGHSLGEYSALAALGDVMPIESLVDVVFYRGMTMQVAVPRDALGRSNYGMCAVNPSRISKTFNDAALRYVVDHISAQTKWLLEIVNYNVENTQYVTAGDLRALDCMTNVLNFMKVQKIDLDKLMQTMSIEDVKEQLSEIVAEIAKKSEAKPQPIELERGFATIPLKGISVPFHSTYLRSGVKPFNRFLIKKVPQQAVKPANLIGKYIPNLTAKPFSISKDYFQQVYDLTGSSKIRNILDNWEKYETA